MSNLVRLRRAAAFASLLVACAWGLTVGCSSKNDDTPAKNEDASVTCPTTVVSAMDPATKCTEEGQVCAIGYACGNFLAQQARCECKAGKYECDDSFGKPIADPEHPPCTSNGGGNDSQCPGDEATANGASCKVPGLQCFYKGLTCPGTKTANTDVCQCVGGGSGTAVDGGAALEFKCEPKGCAPASDGGVIVPLDAKAD